MTQSLTVLVTGATGKQGGGVARALLAKGHTVRALTRKVDSPAAKALEAAGAKLVTGDLSDRAALDRAMAGVDTVFAMSTPFEAGESAETAQGITVADATKAAGAHLVYTSVGSAHLGTGIPHFESKWKVEQHIQSIGAKATIVRPVYFMENGITFGLGQLKEGVYATPLPPGRKLAQIAVADIAAFAALAIENPTRFVGKSIDIAGDDLSGADVVATLTRVVGKPFSYFQVPMEMIRKMSDDMAIMYEWFDRVGYAIDLAALRRDYPEIAWRSFESWAKEQSWKELLG